MKKQKIFLTVLLFLFISAVISFIVTNTNDYNKNNGWCTGSKGGFETSVQTYSYQCSLGQYMSNAWFVKFFPIITKGGILTFLNSLWFFVFLAVINFFILVIINSLGSVLGIAVFLVLLVVYFIYQKWKNR